MSPTTILLWISWAFILTSSINCETVDDALNNVFKRLNQIEDTLSNSAYNSNTNCNRNKIKIGRRNLLNDEPTDDKNIHGNEIENDVNDQNQLPLDNANPDDVVNDDDGANSVQRRGLKLRKLKKHRGRNNSNRLYPAEMHYPYSSGKTGSMNRNVNKNRNVNVNKNVISRRSDNNDATRQTDRDEIQNYSEEVQG